MFEIILKKFKKFKNIKKYNFTSKRNQTFRQSIKELTKQKKCFAKQQNKRSFRLRNVLGKNEQHSAARSGAKKMPAEIWDGMGWWGHAMAYRILIRSMNRKTKTVAGSQLRCVLDNIFCAKSYMLVAVEYSRVAQEYILMPQESYSRATRICEYIIYILF